MLPLSFFFTNPSLTPSLPLFWSVTWSSCLTPATHTGLSCSSLSYFSPAWYTCIDSPTVLSCDRAVFTQSWEAPIPQHSHREQAYCVFSLQTPWVDGSPTRVFLGILLVWLARVFQKPRWGQCRQTDFESLKSKEQNKAHENGSPYSHRSLGQGWNF